MECNTEKTTVTTTTTGGCTATPMTVTYSCSPTSSNSSLSQSPPTSSYGTVNVSRSPPPPPPPQQVIMSPCAACKILRRRCVEKCVLAPYFPPTEPLKFTIAHRVFGASNIIKLLQELPEDQRADAVSSMVYEANARIRDPIYGCAGAICQLQKQVSGLQAELAKAQADVVNLQCQKSNLLAIICMEMTQPNQDPMLQQPYENLNFFTDDGSLSGIFDPFDQGMKDLYTGIMY